MKKKKNFLQNLHFEYIQYFSNKTENIFHEISLKNVKFFWKYGIYQSVTVKKKKTNMNPQ